MDYYDECHDCRLIHKESKKLRILYRSKKFIAVVVAPPMGIHVDRKDGGQITILPTRHVSDRKDFTQSEAKEFMLLSMLMGNAMYDALPKNNIDIALINYQNNSNFSVDKPIGPHLDLHLYGRARSSRYQKHGQALSFPKKGNPYYKKLNPLTKKDEQLLKIEIRKIIKQPKYSLLRRLKK